MVIRKMRINQRSATGYDVLYPETSASMVIDEATGKTVASHLADDEKHITAEERTKWNSPATSADKITIADAGNYYTGTHVEAALQEIGQALNGTRGSIITAVNELLLA
ncbi:hypothetical protein ABER98_01655 [Domibacillus aminovorans]|uniref:hypothetical protein n=1 Tax=Domibacillus aminovorans TaxID=29332 RepID=UPI003D198718